MDVYEQSLTSHEVPLLVIAGFVDERVGDVTRDESRLYIRSEQPLVDAANGGLILKKLEALNVQSQSPKTANSEHRIHSKFVGRVILSLPQ